MLQEQFPFDDPSTKPCVDRKSGASLQKQTCGATANNEQVLSAIKIKRKARRTKLRSLSSLIPFLGVIVQRGLTGRFSYRDLVDVVADQGGPRVRRLVMYRFVKAYALEVFALRTNHQCNRKQPTNSKGTKNAV